jgi:hypothetical protein
VRTSRPLRSTARSPIGGTVTFACAPDSICTLELRTELRDRTASPRMRHRTPNDQAHLAPVPDPVLPYRSTARRSAQVVKLRQNDDTVLCGGRPIPPVRRSDAFMAPAQGRQRSPGAMPSPASSSGIERLAAAVSTGFVGRVATQGRCMSLDGTRAHWQDRWQGGTGSSRVTDH